MKEVLCPNCKSKDVAFTTTRIVSGHRDLAVYFCNDCGIMFVVHKVGSQPDFKPGDVLDGVFDRSIKNLKEKTK
jgi:transcription elongation factor Elf1